VPIVINRTVHVTKFPIFTLSKIHSQITQTFSKMEHNSPISNDVVVEPEMSITRLVENYLLAGQGNSRRNRNRRVSAAELRSLATYYSARRRVVEDSEGEEEEEEDYENPIGTGAAGGAGVLKQVVHVIDASADSSCMICLSTDVSNHNNFWLQTRCACGIRNTDVACMCSNCLVQLVQKSGWNCPMCRGDMRG